MIKFSLQTMLCVAASAFVMACGDKGASIDNNKFDSKYIASEADKGNLAPLSKLNDACDEEVKIASRRLSACKTQDEVRKLVKPITIRF